MPSNGVTLRYKPVKKVGFTDDVTIMAKDAERASTEYASEVGGLYLSRRKSYAQHIGPAKEAPAVTSADVAALKPPRQCPKPWCTRRFFTMKEVRCHVLWHKNREGGSVDKTRLERGMVVAALGPPEHRFFLMFWTDGACKWLLHKHFGPECQHLVDNFFATHFYLDPSSGVEVPDEHRCVQCNKQCTRDQDLQSHVPCEHTFPVRKGTRTYRKTLAVVRQRFQDSLSKVCMSDGSELQNKYKATWVGMIFTADGDEVVHASSHILTAKMKFGEYREIVRNCRLRRTTKIAIYKSVALSRATFGCETVRLTSAVCRKYRVFNTSAYL